MCSVKEVYWTVDKSIRVTSLSLLNHGMLFKTQNFEKVFRKKCLVNSCPEPRHEKLPNLLFNYGNCMMSLFSLTINKTGEIKCIQLTSVAYEPNLKWGKRLKWYACNLDTKNIPFNINFQKERHWRNRPKDNSTNNFGLVHGSKGKHFI